MDMHGHVSILIDVQLLNYCDNADCNGNLIIKNTSAMATAINPVIVNDDHKKLRYYYSTYVVVEKEIGQRRTK